MTALDPTASTTRSKSRPPRTWATSWVWKLIQNLRLRAQRYNESVALAQRYAEQGRALIISPDDTCGVDTLKKDRQSLHRLYQKGYGDAAAIEKFINS